MKKSVAQCLFLVYMQRAGITTITITNKAYRGRTGEVHILNLKHCNDINMHALLLCGNN